MRLVALPQGVVFGVRNRRRVLAVIASVMRGDLFPEARVIAAGLRRIKAVNWYRLTHELKISMSRASGRRALLAVTPAIGEIP